MKKLVNDVGEMLTESLRGFARAHKDLITVHTGPLFVTRSRPTPAGKVGLVSGGGSGHEPLHAGFVGTGMLDAACPGAVFGVFSACARADLSSGASSASALPSPSDPPPWAPLPEAIAPPAGLIPVGSGCAACASA